MNTVEDRKYFEDEKKLSLFEKISQKEELESEIFQEIRDLMVKFKDEGLYYLDEDDVIIETIVDQYNFEIIYHHYSQGEYINDHCIYPKYLVENPTKEAIAAFKKKLDDDKKAKTEQVKIDQDKKLVEQEKKQLLFLLQKYGNELEIEKIK